MNLLKNLAFVTCRDWPELTPSDRLAAQVLRQAGDHVSPAIWDDGEVDWRSYDAVVLRSTWDYHLRPDAFRDWLARLGRSGCELWNPTEMVLWNMDKSYLGLLETSGVPIVPTVFLKKGEKASLLDLMDHFDCPELVIKPTIAATAHGLTRVSRHDAARHQARIDDTLEQQQLMAQPLVKEVPENGEWSLIFFDGEFSHAVVKRARMGDLRVQSEHGGRTDFRHPHAALLEQANEILRRVESRSLYARVDLVEVEGRALLMELELIEPELYFFCDENSPERFRKALHSVLAG